jgi:hypothetical protein
MKKAKAITIPTVLYNEHCTHDFPYPDPYCGWCHREVPIKTKLEEKLITQVLRYTRGCNYVGLNLSRVIKASWRVYKERKKK